MYGGTPQRCARRLTWAARVTEAAAIRGRHPPAYYNSRRRVTPSISRARCIHSTTYNTIL